MRRLPLVAVLVGVALAVILWQHVTHKTQNHAAHVVSKTQYPLFSASACAKTVVFTWYDAPTATGYEPILCGLAPPSDTGDWGANLPEPGQQWPPSATSATPVSRAPASGCPATFCSPNPNPAVPAARTGLP